MSSDHQTTIILVSAIIVTLLSTFVALFIVLKRRQQMDLNNKSSHSGKADDFIPNVPMEIIHNEITLRCTYFPAAQKAPASFVIESPCNCNGAFCVKSEGRLLSSPLSYFQSLSLGPDWPSISMAPWIRVNQQPTPSELLEKFFLQPRTARTTIYWWILGRKPEGMKRSR